MLTYTGIPDDPKSNYLRTYLMRASLPPSPPVKISDIGPRVIHPRERVLARMALARCLSKDNRNAYGDPGRSKEQLFTYIPYSSISTTLTTSQDIRYWSQSDPS
ncbi:unnamed protein product [Tuber aestivum]|uniref:Uncharacterized protein n=1 Tax=Tuber aestivum TaxID=59557 RepID=A0A292PSP2_9PEZI|nr:unnamed protein product [Tuber aestivum]